MRLLLVLFILTFLVQLPASLMAMPGYAERTGQACASCHVAADEGSFAGGLNETGMAYAASGYVWPPGQVSTFGPPEPVKRWGRTFVGFFHILGAFTWFGTILYVHILLRPGYASKGLPRGEVGMGLVSMAAVGFTGVLLTVSRLGGGLGGMEVFYSTRWGALLSVKILLYLVMVASALAVVTVVGPRLRRSRSRPVVPSSGVFDPATLSAFDGAGGRPACIAFRGKVYDVTDLKLWAEGEHMRAHRAGQDLTEAISRAPHGDEKMEGLKSVGAFDAALKPPKSGPQKAFYFVAYMNLGLVFVTLFVVALWRWGA